MQGWERPLMEQSARILCGYGSTFLEAGLGLGYSARAIAGDRRTARHTVVELRAEIITAFTAGGAAPPNLEILCDDFFAFVRRVPDASVDGIFFDPALPARVWNDEAFWNREVPQMTRVLRPGGALIPFFSTEPSLRTQFVRHFETIVVRKRPYRAYDTTMYTHGTQGDAYIQCFVKS